MTEGSPAAAGRDAADEPRVPVSASARRRRLTYEVWLVLGVTVLGSVTLAVLNLVDRYTIDVPLAQQSTSLNPSQNERPWLDLLYQLRRYAFLALPALLALYLLSTNGRSAVRRIGLDLTRPGRDLLQGLGLAAAVGIPGLGVYALGRALGVTVEVRPATLDAFWWTIPVLILGALANGFLEEVVVVGYLAERLKDLRWGVAAIILASAILRGSYHLYQGPGMAIGNVAMGVLFAWFYLVPSWGRRVMPLVVAHTVIDVVAFVGYSLLPEALLTALGVG
ncbi:CPBP family intramembrane metalloprotease domain-containing protein [Serinibacter arcticus]|uniref:CPBP family intramembrane metalloprotease domain-containing protein n=1 Tax=Serinibacter arcticus TaxID=1655435 RepID=A0A2U1ZVH1_9MICO|nr:CPBP family intramembrane glutamic endopeptidase [Serinibacter arcticus]PWD50978.1 CPBP family intramembrane metalloprotease domain-containing protein [Serinibacter arcticus]